MSNLAKNVGKGLNLLSHVAPKYASHKAMQLFTTPRKGRPSDKQLKFLSTSQVKTAKYGNLEVKYYHWKGKGPTLILAHGWESNSGRWAYLIPSLQDAGFDIVALDAPAHGQSGGKYFNALLYSEFIHAVAQVHPPDVTIGHSVGGLASIFMRKKYPLDGLKKMVSLGSPSEFTMVFENYVKLMGYNNKIAKGLDDIVVQRFGRSPSYYSGANFAKDFGQSMLFVHDKTDKIIPYHQGLLYEQNCPHGKLITTEGYGHGLKTPEVSQHILDFIRP